jgi:hypothetical protein
VIEAIARVVCPPARPADVEALLALLQAWYPVDVVPPLVGRVFGKKSVVRVALARYRVGTAALRGLRPFLGPSVARGVPVDDIERPLRAPGGVRTRHWQRIEFNFISHVEVPPPPISVTSVRVRGPTRTPDSGVGVDFWVVLI